jgi:O-methyltransferase
MIKDWIHNSLRVVGFDLVRFPPRDEVAPPDFRGDELAILNAVRPWTMTSSARIYALIQAVRYISAHNIVGAIVECGVWKGGSMAAVARTLLQLGDESRELYLFDTFEGMTSPTENDLDYTGKPARQLLRDLPGDRCDDAPLDRVKEVLFATGYPQNQIHFIKGPVEQTIPASAPTPIALLRLDTDWYESTMHELVHLYPHLSHAGVLIIDDYGHWQGARKACDEYLSQNRLPILLNRIDYTGRIAIKP